MGNSGSRSQGGDARKLSSHEGFTPLTPQKKPGSISATVAHQPSSTSGQTPPLSPTIESPIMTQSGGVRRSSVSSEERAGEGPRAAGSETTTPQKLRDSSAEAAAATPTSAQGKGGAVYGAAYPPHMAAVMMQKEIEKVQGKKGSKEGSDSPGKEDPKRSPVPVESDREPSTPGTHAHANGEAAAHQTPASADVGQKQDEGLESFKQSKESRADAKYTSVLEQPIVPLAELQTMCWSGCPMKHRPNTWRLLLRYMPANADRRAAMMTRLRSEYADAVEKYFTSYDEKTASQYDKTMYHQIAVDLPRTNPSLDLFQNERVQQSLHRILFVWGIRHPGTGYVQGINDLVTPFFFVFLKEVTGAADGDVSTGKVMEGLSQELLDGVEADSYHCLTNMLDNAQDNYVMDSKGIQEKVFVLRRIIARLDDKLFRHLEAMEVEFLQFSFRWFNCLLMREFSLQCTLRLWDTYVAEKSFAGFHVYVCAAVLLNFSKELQTMDFPDMIVFLQKLPTESWDESKIDMLVAQAYSWNQQWSAGHI